MEDDTKVKSCYEIIKKGILRFNFQPKSTGEQKTKPTQSSVRELRGLGLAPDLIFCRSQTPLLEDVRKKISNFCHVDPECVIGVPDVSSIYR